MQRSFRLLSHTPAFSRAMQELLPQGGFTLDDSAPAALVEAGLRPPALPHAVFTPPMRAGDLFAALEALSQPQLAEGVTFDEAARLLSHPGGELPLTEKEAAFLAALASSPQGLPRAELLQRVWGYGEDIQTHTLETHVHRLRAKLGAIGGEEWIETLEDGYRLKVFA